jgi:DNA-binding LytR/AlgR family response regulator
MRAASRRPVPAPRQALAAQRDPAGGVAPPWEAALGQLRSLLATPALAGRSGAGAPERLQVIQAGVGNAIHLVPVDDVVYFEAADKYVRVVTGEREHLIRVALRDLLPQLDPQRFWQIHRGTVVRAEAIAVALRDESGKLTLTLRGRPERLAVSRLYAHRFKAM